MIAVIGGSGFIGTQLIGELIASGKEVVIIDKQESKVYPHLTRVLDILDKRLLIDSLKNVSTVYNLAAEHKDNVDPISLYYTVNVEGAYNVCEACDINGIKQILFTSSVAVYGLNKDNPDENFKPDPFNHYGKSKLEAEEVYLNWFKKNELNDAKLVVIRPTVVFGEGNRGNVYNLFRQIASGKFLRVGSGRNKKSMAYVRNISAFGVFCNEHLGAGLYIFNYADKPDLCTNELIDLCEKTLNRKIPKLKVPYYLVLFAASVLDIVSKITGKELPISAIRVKKFCATTQYDASKAHSSGFLAPHVLKEGLDKTLKSEFQFD